VSRTIAAYYVADRQSDALEAFQRLADELGIDPSPALRELHERVLRQEPLDVKKAAKTTAATCWSMLMTVAAAVTSAVARIGRSTDNHIVLLGVEVSRHHAVIIDTGASYVITDLRSANGVELDGQRVQISATLADGDRIRIGEHEFTFDMLSARLDVWASGAPPHDR
jgi:hypothetical protein